MCPTPQLGPSPPVADHSLNIMAPQSAALGSALQEARQASGDGDWSTRVRWVFDANAYVAELSWTVAGDTEAGDYRFVHTGLDPTGIPFEGMSEAFEVVATASE